MWKTASMGILMAGLALCAGCRLDTGPLTTPPPSSHASGVPGGSVDLVSATEVDLVEKVQQSRQEYRQSLEMLVDYYSRSGHKQQLEQAKSELDGFKTMPQYSYVGDIAPGPQLKASVIIAEADALYLEALRLHREANALVVLKDRLYQRRALDVYRQLISRFPTSDKIDDAAFQIGTIYEDLKDYQAALVYYQRAYQWDANTQHPARFKAGYVLDIRMRRKAEALEIYQEALRTEGLRQIEWQKWTEKRVQELTRGAEGTGQPAP